MPSEDRLKENIKSPYPTEEGTVWHSILSTLGNEIDKLTDSQKDVLDSKTVDSASGKQLDFIGELTNTVRRTYETDEHFRYRIKLAMAKYLSGTTVGEIQNICGMLLNVPPRKIGIEEDFDSEYARFRVTMRRQYLKRREVTKDEFLGFVNQIRGAGIRVIVEARGSFSYRSEDEYLNGVNDSTEAYNQSEYAALLRGVQESTGTFTYRSEEDYLLGTNQDDLGYYNGSYGGLLK